MEAPYRSGSAIVQEEPTYEYGYSPEGEAQVETVFDTVVPGSPQYRAGAEAQPVGYTSGTAYPTGPRIFRTAEVEVPDYAPYPTLPLTSVRFLRGRRPIDERALQGWEWEPTTRKFVNKERRTFMSRPQFLRSFFEAGPDEAEEACSLATRVVPLSEGDVAEGIADGEAALRVVVRSEGSEVAGAFDMVLPWSATRADIIDALASQSPAVDPRELRGMRVVLFHPMMYDNSTDSADVGAVRTDIAGEDTLYDVASAFPFPEGESPLGYTIPVEILPPLRHPPRLARSSRSAGGRRSVGEQVSDAKRGLEALRQARLERERGLAELRSRAGRTREEYEADLEQAAAGRRVRRRTQTTPAGRQESEARRLLLRVLDALFAHLHGDAVLSPQDEADLRGWLVSALLSGKVAEGVDYAREYQRIHDDILRERPEGGGRDTLSWANFLHEVDLLVEEARDIDAYTARVRDREPVFDPDTGEVVDYTEELYDDLLGAPGGGIDVVSVAPVPGIDVGDQPVATTSALEVPMVQCYECQRYRAMAPDYRRTDFTAQYVEPGMSEAQERVTTVECQQFGFVFRHDRTGREERVPANSEYVVWSSPSREALSSVPQELVSGGEIRGFGATRELEGSRPAGRPTIEVAFNIEPNAYHDLDPTQVRVYALVHPNAVSQRTGEVLVRPRDPDRSQPQLFVVPGGRAVSFYCIRTVDGVEVTIPLIDMRGFMEHQWRCGDPGQEAHSAPTRELLTRLRSLENLYRARILDPTAQEELAARMDRIRHALHAEPEETSAEIEARVRGTSVVSVADREWENRLAELDEIAERRFRRAAQFIDAEAEEGDEMTPEEALEDYRLQEAVRERGELGPDDLLLLSEEEAEEGAEQQNPTEVAPPAAARGGTETVFQRALAVLERHPEGVHHRDVARELWVAQGRPEGETRGAGSQAFQNFDKQVNATLKRPRREGPVVYLESVAPGPGRGSGRFVLRRFVTPATVERIIATARRDARQRNARDYDEERLRSQLREIAG